jgi:hypothetical protein
MIYKALICKKKAVRNPNLDNSGKAVSNEPRVISFIDEESHSVKAIAENNGKKSDAKRKLSGSLVATSKKAKTEVSEVNGVVLSKAERKEERRRRNLQWKAFTNKSWNNVDPNPRHSLYYKRQFPDLEENDEWTAFQRCLGTELPVTFRLCPHRGAEVARAMRHRIESKVGKP